MIKNPAEQDEDELLEILPAERAAFGNRAGARFSEMDETDDLLEIPELISSAPDVYEESETATETPHFELTNEIAIQEPQPETSNELPFQAAVEPESVGETARKSGLAYGAALTLFGSVVFMLILGWFADKLLGTSPWGIVLGIVLGAAIGFYQFFRITSQIFKK